jgi:hypothetical protein
MRNPNLRQQITKAADQIDLSLGIDPQNTGEVSSPRTRQHFEPPLVVLFAVSEDDCTVRVLYVKLRTIDA